jgi:pyridoxamine 5'-phosphate oxidase
MKKLHRTIHSLRNDYAAHELDESGVRKNPIRQFEDWMRQALEAKAEEPNAMTLATAGAGGTPDLRVVLLRGISREGFTFYTNYGSAKGRQLAKNKRASLNFFWPELQRQVRVQGVIQKVPARVSDAYFNSRPRDSRIGAWASLQSVPLSGREALMDRVQQYEAEFRGRRIPRPPYWGGYLLTPRRIEFWQGRASRLHDRILYEKKRGGWKISRLSP